MQNLLRNKLFIILFSFIVLTFVLCTSCFASTNVIIEDYNGDSHTITLNDELSSTNYHYLFYLKSTTTNSHYLFYITCDVELFYGDVNLGYTTLPGCLNTIDNKAHDIKYYSFTDFKSSSFESKIEEFNNLTLNDLKISNNKYYNATVFNSGQCIYASQDLKDIDGNVVFQGAPQVVIPEITKTLVEQTTQVGMQPLTLIKTLLPIVIATILGLIGFWKAWQLLLKNLRKA